MKVLYSFPHKLGAKRICWTAWQQVIGISQAGIEIIVAAGALARTPPALVPHFTTLGRGRLRIPYKLIGARRASIIHDWRVSRWLARHPHSVDLVHAWPMGALRTIAVASAHSIPVLLERPNAHTEFAYNAVEEECTSLGIQLPIGYEHKYDAKVLARETKEFQNCNYLLCPSDFVARTFSEKGFEQRKLLRHHYGFDETLYFPEERTLKPQHNLNILFAGLCTPRKGLHYALKAWHQSTVSKHSKLRICGKFVPYYREKLSSLLNHPNIEVLGHRDDLPKLMRESDIFILPSVEEGSALVTYEARGSGCVLLVSDATGAPCQHGVNGLIHPSKDLETLTSQLTQLDFDRALLARLRNNSLSTRDSLTWTSAGKLLAQVYKQSQILKR